MRNLLWTNANPDDTVCPTCRELIGCVFTPDEAPPCPVHPSCFCLLVPTDQEHNTTADATGFSKEAQEGWAGYTAYLLRRGYQVPAFLQPLQEAAHCINKERMEKNMPQENEHPEEQNLGSLPADAAAPPAPKIARRLSLAAEIKREGSNFQIVLIDPGEGNGYTWTPEVLQRDCRLFDNLTSFTNHERLDVLMARPGGRTIDDICGVVHGVQWNGAAVVGTWRATPPKGEWVAAMIDQIITDREQGLPVPDVGVSLDLAAYCDQTGKVTAIDRAYSADIVFNAARGPRFGEAFARITNAVQHKGDPKTMPEEKPTPKDQVKAETNPQATPPRNEWLDAIRLASINTIIATSGLPEPSRQRILAQNHGTPDELNAAIQSEREYLAKLTEAQVIDIGSTPPRSAHITMGRTSLEQVANAFEALMGGRRPDDGVQPLTGIRELYHILSGDYEMTGLFLPERVMLANVTSSTMAGLVANALNKVLVKEFIEYPQWWLPIAAIQDFATMQDIRWITLGGIGELPTVSEGAAYTELTWDDQTETNVFIKKGGYLGITLEAIDKDDTYKLRAAPKALAQAAWLTLSKSISGIFTDASGVGRTMSDGKALFHTDHSNLGTSALSFSAWEATRIAMRKQTELNTSERLGALVAPRFLLAPPDLETTALQILMSVGEPGTPNNDENPFADGNDRSARLDAARQRLIVVDLWTDTKSWATLADPKLYPTIGIGFRYGRQPEIFSVASPTAGLMFSNDVMPIKVRFVYAVGPMDWRGMYKHNVP